MKKNNCLACKNIINGVKSRKSTLHTCGKDSNQIIKLMKDRAAQDFYDKLTYKGD